MHNRPKNPSAYRRIRLAVSGKLHASNSSRNKKIPKIVSQKRAIYISSFQHGSLLNASSMRKPQVCININCIPKIHNVWRNELWSKGNFLRVMGRLQGFENSEIEMPLEDTNMRKIDAPSQPVKLKFQLDDFLRRHPFTLQASRRAA